jgi:hypothetical protein
MTPEACVLRSVLDLLAAKRILAFRNNVGVMRGAHKGKNYFVKFGTVGMADVIAYPKMNPQNISGCQICDYFPGILWIEAKAVGRKQTPEQKSFQHIVEANGHSYLVVDDISKLIAWLKEHGL